MPDSAVTQNRQTAGVAAVTFGRPIDPHFGILTGFAISDDGGLAISWAGGRVRTPAGNVITIAAGSGTCTDDAVNYLNWISGTSLTLSTTMHVHAVELGIGHIACQNGDIWEVHNDPPISALVPDIQMGLEAIFPLAVASGCLVSEDTDATDPLDVNLSSGVYYHDLHDAHTIIGFDTRTANTLIRCFIDGSGPETWDFTADGAQSEIDVANWNSGTSLIGTSVGKYYKGLFVVSEDNVFWIYAQEQHNTVAQAIDGALPSTPPGLDNFPRSVAYIYKHGDTAFEAVTSDRWMDVRPLVTGSVAAGPITDHGNLVGLGDDDHPQYTQPHAILDGNRDHTDSAGAADAAAGALIVGNGDTEWERLLPGTGLQFFLMDSGIPAWQFISDITAEASPNPATDYAMLFVTGSGDHRKVLLNDIGAVLDHGGLQGRGDDDHAQYLLADGTRALSGAWAANNDITGLTKLEVDSLTLDGTAVSSSAALTLAAVGLLALQGSSFKMSPIGLGDDVLLTFNALAQDGTLTYMNTEDEFRFNALVQATQLKSTGTLQVDGVAAITGIADGGLTSYDLKVGDTTTPDYGMIQFGNAVIGRTSYNVGAIDLDGAIMVRNIGGPVTSEIEFIWTESAGNTCRFALPKSALGNATYNSRSMLLAGPAPADTDFVKVSYWQGQGIFDNLVCDTAGDGADLGVQNDLEVEGDIFVDDILESTTAAGVTIEAVLLKDGLVDGRDIATDGALLDTAMQDLVDDTSPELGGNLDFNNKMMIGVGDGTHDLVLDNLYIRAREDTPGNFQAGSIFFISVDGDTQGGRVDILGGDAAGASDDDGGNVTIGGGLKDGSGTDGKILLSSNMDFSEYKAIAMVCDNGATLPAGPTNGQWFLHTPTGRTILYMYCGGVWCAIVSFGSMTVYVDKTDGTDSQDKGGAVDAGAFATIQFAVDQIPGLVGGNVVININNETYAESVTVQGKAFVGNYNILFEGQFAEQLSETTVQTGSIGSTVNQATLTVAGTPWGVNDFQYMWVKFEDDTTTAALRGQELLIDSNTNNTITFLNMIDAAPTGTDTFTIQDQDTAWGMTASGTEPILRVEVAQTNVDCHRIYFLETTEVPTLWMIEYLANSFGRWDACRMTQDTRLLMILVRGGSLFFQDCFIDGARASSGTRCITLEDGAAVTINHTLVRCLNNTTSGNRTVYFHSNSILSVTGSMVTRARHGLYAELGASARVSGSNAAEGELRTTDCNTGWFAQRGGLIGITLGVFQGNTTNKNPAAASDPAWIKS